MLPSAMKRTVMARMRSGFASGMFSWVRIVSWMALVSASSMDMTISSTSSAEKPISSKSSCNTETTLRTIEESAG